MRDARPRFVALALVGFIPVAFATARATNEVYDFWEHAATVRQLMLHLGNPGNALLASHVPSAFYSPYTVLLALVAKATGTGAVHLLAAIGLVNYWLLIVAVWYFARVFSAREQTPFYALLFIWFLWGPDPWKYSGFFNYRSLSEVIAYPSTFATALGMLTVALWHRVCRSRQDRWPLVALTGLGLAVTVITHPVAGTATGAALLAVSLTSGDRRRSVTRLLLVGAGAGLLCLVWPYYPVFKLLGSQSAYDPSNAVMYSAWVSRIFPALAVGAVCFIRTDTLSRARLVIYGLILAVVFLYGDVSQHYSDGRVISYIVIGAQIGIADLVATFEQPLLSRWHGGRRALALGLVAVLGIAEVANMKGGLRATLPGTGTPAAIEQIYTGYRQAVTGLSPNATIATPVNDGAEAVIPVYAGRLIATHRPLAFVDDQSQRRRTLDTFFSLTATTSYRRRVLARYHVRYIVIPSGATALATPLARFGPLIRHGTLFETIKVAASTY